MAAWNERRLVRDIYDIWFFLKMGIQPDGSVLQARLSNPEYSRLVNESDHFMKGGSVNDFFAFLSTHARTLSDAEIVASLGDYLSPADMGGLAMRIRAELAKLV